MASNSYFEKGDILVSKHGKRPFKVSRRVNKNTNPWSSVEGYYLHNNVYVDFKVSEVKYFEDPISTDKTNSNSTMNILYSFEHEGKTAYGVAIATNSAGKLVIELKGSETAAIVVKSPDEVKEVVPYTFSVSFAGNAKSMHFVSEEGKISEGDLLMYMPSNGSPQIVLVDKVDTKARDAKAKFPGVKILTQPL